MNLTQEEIEIELSFALSNSVTESMKARMIILLLSMEKNKLTELFAFLQKLCACDKDSSVKIDWDRILKVVDYHQQIQFLKAEQHKLAEEVFQFLPCPNLSIKNYAPFKALKGERRVMSKIGNEFETKLFAGYWLYFRKRAKELLGRMTFPQSFSSLV